MMMTDATWTPVQLFVVAFAALAIGSIAAALLYPAFRRVLRHCAPATRSLVTLVYALMAPISALIVTLLSYQPRYAELLVPGHCHAGSCGSHPPLFPVDTPGGLGLTAVSVLLCGLALAGIFLGLRMGHRRLRTLAAFGRRTAGHDYYEVESRDLIAWCCGLWNPRIFVSRALVEHLTPEQFAVVVDHERAHAARLDNLRAAILDWCTLPWPAARRRDIRRDLTTDCEQACDRLALERSRDVAVFAETLAAIRNPASCVPAGRALGFGHDGEGVRIAAASMDEASFRPSIRAWLLLVLLYASLTITTTSVSHYVLEWFGAIGY
ncbi:MAG: M56 family metallopeptidase [Gammaproteobacteria bacterium]|jgi:hypothetical protein